MRTIKFTTVSILVLGLLAGSAVGAAAQDGETATGSSYFTGTFEPVFPPSSEGTETETPDGLNQTRGVVHEGETLQTSDPRVSGSVLRVLNSDGRTLAEREIGPEVLTNFAEAWRLVNDGGSWTGQGTSFQHAGAVDEPTDLVTMVLTGEGGYEGLTA